MGKFSSTNSVEVIESINLGDYEDKPNSNKDFKQKAKEIKFIFENLNENLRILISYCWSDREASHALADEFIENQFQVWIDRDKTSSGDLFFAMENCDVVLLLISKSYLNCSDCQREARYAFEYRNMNIVVVSLNKSFVPDKWKAQVIGGKNYQMLTDSKKFSSAHFGHIIDKIVSIILEIKRSLCL
jgi:hypothetical protein